MAQFAYNSAKASATQESPFYANYGYEPSAYREPLRLQSDRAILALAHNNLGNALEKQGKPAEAIAYFRKAIELDPTHVVALGNLGRLLRELRPDAKPLAKKVQTTLAAAAAGDLAALWPEIRTEADSVAHEAERKLEALAKQK